MTQKQSRERRSALSLFEDWTMPSFPSWMRLDELLHDADGRQLIKVDEFTEGDQLVVRAEIPGTDPDEDIDITVDDSVLHISAERTEEHEDEDQGEGGRRFHRRELRYGSFARHIPLPDGVDEDAVTANYENGVLEVRVPIPESAPASGKRRIPISRT